MNKEKPQARIGQVNGTKLLPARIPPHACAARCLLWDAKVDAAWVAPSIPSVGVAVTAGFSFPVPAQPCLLCCLPTSFEFALWTRMKKPTMSPHKGLVLIGKQLPRPLDYLLPLPLP